MPSVPLPSVDDIPRAMRDAAHWILWKAEERGEKIAKVPCDHAGQTASMKEGHMTFDDALMHAKRIRAIRGEHFGVGLSFVDGIGIVGVDLDAALVDGVRADHLAWALDNHPTWGEFSLSGVGVHLFYSGNFEGKRNALIGESRFEIFGTKGFIAVTGRVLPGSLADCMDFASFGEALSPFLEKLPERRSLPAGTFINPNQNGAGLDTPYGQAALRDECAILRGTAKGGLHYALCRAAGKIGMLIPAYLSWGTAEAELYAATEDAGGRDMGAARKTIIDQLEWGSGRPVVVEDKFDANGDAVDLSGFMTGGDDSGDEILAETEHKIPDPGPFPKHLLCVPGLVSSVMEFTNKNSFVVQPVLALAGALALMAVLTGRKVTDKTGSRTNVYILSVAGSGEGKDAARRTNKRLLFDAGAGVLVGAESWASGPGLLAAVEKQPAVLFQNDEIGRFLQTTADPGKSPHLFSVVSILLKLYSSSADVYLGDAYADGRQSNIVQPCCVVYGTTVPGSLYAALTEDSITNGLMGRLFVFEADPGQADVQDPESVEPPDELIDLVRRWYQWQPSHGNLAGQNPGPMVVPTDGDAEECFRSLRTNARDQRAILGDTLGSLWVRSVENAKKLALLYACSEAFGGGAKIGLNAAEWACELTKYLIGRQCWTASTYIARNAVESSSMAMERLIRAAGPDGITGMEIHHKTRHLRAKERDEIIGDLIKGRLVTEKHVPTKGRPKRIYVAL